MSQTIEGLRRPAHYLPELESLRGWAVLLVIGFHYFGILFGDRGDHGLGAAAPAWMKIIAAGNTGVTLFFVLSGFLLSLPFLEAQRQRRDIDIRRFYWARALRILPLYYLAILVAWLFTGSADALKALFFIPVGFGLFPFSVPWWSLCTEIQFYLLLPWTMLLLRWRLGRWVVALALLAWAAAHLYLLSDRQWLAAPGHWSIADSLFGRGGAFLAGAFFAWLYNSGWSARWLGRRGVAGLVGSVALAALLALLAWYGEVGQRPAVDRLPMYHNLEALLWGCLLLCSLHLRGGVRSLLLNPLLEHIGKISYSLYLVHVPVQFYLLYWVRLATQQMATPLQPLHWLALVGSLPLIWLLSFACYRCIERPFLNLKARLPVFASKPVAMEGATDAR
ncbi:acyltransferase family protein [Pseudomonas sp. A6]|uniref:acyltransferase family protein n=1 Tax=Pseudomonas sp. A6 TaxID=410021 RepID=UPI004024D2A9